MTIVISDTSPLNYLIQIGSLEILPRLFSLVIIPPAVVSELRHADAPEAVKNWAGNLPAWIEIRAPEHPIAIAKLGFGECEALSLAIQLRADLILLDDLAARDAAIARNLKSAGTLSENIAPPSDSAQPFFSATIKPPINR